MSESGESRPAVRVFVVYLVFSALCGIILPVLICAGYHIPYYPQDFFRMPKLGGDYVATYIASRALWQGRDIYKHYPDSIDATATGPISRYSYAPPQAYLFVPLGLLSYEHSYWAWVGLTIALIVLCSIVAGRMYAPTAPPALVAIAGGLIYAQSSFLIFECERGQTNALILTCLVLSAYFSTRGRHPYLTGLFCGLGIALKLTPGIFLLFLLTRRQWRAIATTFGWAVLIVLATGVRDWYTWDTRIVPVWSQIFLGYGIDHSLLYLFQGFTDALATARIGSQVAAVLLVALYLCLALLNRDRDRYVPLELAILFTIMELATPFSANYKQVLLLFLFLAPFAVLSIEEVRRQPIRFVLPFFASFALMVSMFGEHFTRWPFTILARLTSSTIIGPDPLGELFPNRKVIVGILLALVYMLGLYAWVAIRSRPAWAAALLARIPRPLRRLSGMRLALGALVTLVLAGTGWVMLSLNHPDPIYARTIAAFGEQRPLNDRVRLAGYVIYPKKETLYHVEAIFHCLKPMRETLAVYLHAGVRDEQGQLVGAGGKNFLPSIITSTWPRNRYVVVHTDLFLVPNTYDLKVGMFSLVDGRQYGEASMGTIDLTRTDGLIVPEPRR